ncbi:glycosyltransferase family 4 protein [Patescibacteria group bacterium]
MKKTLLVTCQFPPDIGGVETYLYNIAKRLDSEKLVVLAEEGEYIPIKKIYRNKKCVKFDRQQEYRTIRSAFFNHHKFVWPRWLPLLKGLEKVVEEEGIEQILAGQVLPVGTAAKIVGDRQDIPYSVCTYAFDIEVARQHWRRKRTLKKVLSGAKDIFTISEDTRKRITEVGIPDKKITKITPGLDMDEFIPDEKTLAKQTEELKKRHDLHDKKVILTIGRLVARKGQDTVINSLPQILKEVPNAHYVIAGKGEYGEKLEQLVKKLKLTDHVTFTGKFAESAKAAWYNLCDVFTMVSRIEQAVDIEGFGIVYLEANALGKPVVGANVGGVPDAVVNNQTGLLVNDPTSLEEVAAAIKKLLLNQELAQNLGRNGLERVQKFFNWNDLVEEFERYL